MFSARQIKALGAEVRRVRKEKGLSQAQLAADLGINQGHLSKLERGEFDDKKKYLERALSLLNPSFGDASVDEIVRHASLKIRTSPTFRSLVEAALKAVR